MSEPEVIDGQLSVDDALVEEEIIIESSTSDTVRRIRVYDRRGDFIIEVPANATLTFGYFNPTAAGDRHGDQRAGWGEAADGGRNTFKTTCLRVREKGEKSPQIAAFLGVSGFRDERIKLTKLSQRVVIETNLDDDGEGTIQFGGKQQRQIIAAPEPDTYA